MSENQSNPFFGEHRSGEALGAESLRSGVYSIASRAASVFVQVGSTVILARLLTPEDFGLVAMVVAFTGFIPVLSDLGTRDAVVQRPTIDEHEVSALFWLTVGVGTILGLLLVLSSSAISAFYGEPRLTNIALASAAGFVVAAASCQHVALLRRAMLFRQIALIEVGSNLLSSVAAILMAIAGAGYWALVAKPVLLAVCTLLGVGASCRWVPRIPAITQGVKEMIRFGLHVTGFTMSDYIGRSIDRIAIGYRSGTAPLGFYQQSLFVYDNTLGLLAISLHPVAVAALSKLTDDVAALKRAWAKALSTLAFFAMPAFGLLAVTAQDLMVMLLGDKWRYTGVLVSVLALRGIPHVIERTLGWLHVPAGRADRWMRWGLIGTATQIVALFCGLPFGVIGVVTAYAISTYVLFIPAIVYAGRPLGIGIRDVLQAVGAPLIGALVTVVATFALRHFALQDTSALVRVLALGAAYMALYALIVIVLLGTREPLSVAVRLLREVSPQPLRRFLS
ncbi:MAG: lipopolysaccharide biosynthesis protein [Steroidobacteraceae bacterium]